MIEEHNFEIKSIVTLLIHFAQNSKLICNLLDRSQEYQSGIFFAILGRGPRAFQIGEN